MKIPSFEKNHDTLDTGLYARTDENGITTFDLRMKKPNAGDYLSQKALHSIEHMMATVLRNGAAGKEIVYFGPMGCRTGFYLLTVRLSFREVLDLLKTGIKDALTLDEVPGAKREECGNYLEHDIIGAKEELKNYFKILENL